MNVVKYRDIQEDNLIWSARELWLGRGFIFQQDNYPKHMAKQKSFKDGKASVLEWPSQSLGLNPIKNLWQLNQTLTENVIFLSAAVE